MSAEWTDRVGTVTTGGSEAREAHASGYWFQLGYRFTPYGIVATHTESRRIVMWFIHDGLIYTRSAERGYGGKGLSRVAGEFARDVVDGRIASKRQRRAAGRKPA